MLYLLGKSTDSWFCLLKKVRVFANIVCCDLGSKNSNFYLKFILMAELEGQSIEIRTPKRVLHFSDGTLEEFDDDDDDMIEANTPVVEQIDEVCN